LPLFCIALIPLTYKLIRTDCEYQVHGTKRKISHLLYMDDLKLQGRNEDDLEYKIKIVKAISKDNNMNFGLKKCARMCLKKGRVQSKLHVGSIFEKDIKELDLREACKCLGIGESHDLEDENKKEKLKKGILEETEISFGLRIKYKE